MKHFAKFVGVGATRFDVGGLPTNIYGLAFKSAGNGARASLLLMNMGSSASSIDLTAVGLGMLSSAVQTTSAQDWMTLHLTEKPSLPGLSITTLVFN